MKFMKNSAGDWVAYESPYEFQISTPRSRIELWARVTWESKIIKPITRSHGSRKNFASIEEAIAYAHEWALQRTLEQLQRMAPPGGRAAEIDGVWQFVCDGRRTDEPYRCMLPIGHSGECWCGVKKVNFVPDNRR